MTRPQFCLSSPEPETAAAEEEEEESATEKKSSRSRGKLILFDLTMSSIINRPSREKLVGVGDRGIFVSCSKWKGAVRVHVRKYTKGFGEKSDLFPTKIGIALSQAEMEELFGLEKTIRKMTRKCAEEEDEGEEAETQPPTTKQKKHQSK